MADTNVPPPELEGESRKHTRQEPAAAQRNESADFWASLRLDRGFPPGALGEAALSVEKWRGMLVIPAIDLLGAQVVRLQKGERDKVTVYSDDPVGFAESYAQAGAERVHVVDLDGAFSGKRAHSDVLARLCKECSVPVQVGGGIRDRAALDSLFADGARYAVLGTAAIKSPDFVQEACESFPDRIVVAVDAKDGQVAVEGWVEDSGVSAIELGKRARDWGAHALLYTDVGRDGMHSGPNVEATRALFQACKLPVIASGGISTLDDIRNLKAAGIPMTVVGRALYDRHFTAAQAIEAGR